MFDALGMNKEQFKILFNDDREKNLFEKYGFNGEIVNLHSWIENRSTFNIMPEKKSYSAIYIAKLIESNRHELASNIEDLALITSDSFGALAISKVPSNSYLNESNLTEIEMVKKINESKCGLNLSELDVGEFAVCNYFLCGVPIITTHKEGISQIWLNENNSIIVESNNRNIIEATEILKKSPKNPELIRNECIAKIEENRNRFKNLLSETFSIREVDYINVNLFYEKNISHNKITNFLVPKFEYIFT
jgi:glycosyltransferase involved in cell wall biosynthesis